MGTFTYPGVYIEELPSGVHTIAGVATSIAAFVGWAPKGPTNEAVLVQSFMDFQRQFGGLDARSLLGYAVSQFFSNGGQQAYIVRVAQAAITSGTASGVASGAASVSVTGGAVVFTAKNPGAWSSAYGVQVSAASGATFNASVVYAPQGKPLVTLETLTGLSASSIGHSEIELSDDHHHGLTHRGSRERTVHAHRRRRRKRSKCAGGGGRFGHHQAQGSTTAGFTFTAQNPGVWGNLLAIGATPQAGDATNTRFSVNVVAMNAGNGTLSVVETLQQSLCELLRPELRGHSSE